MKIVKHQGKEAEELQQSTKEFVSDWLNIENNCAVGMVIINKNGDIYTHIRSLTLKDNLTLIGGIEALKTAVINGCIYFEEGDYEPQR